MVWKEFEDPFLGFLVGGPLANLGGALGCGLKRLAPPKGRNLSLWGDSQFIGGFPKNFKRVGAIILRVWDRSAFFLGRSGGPKVSNKHFLCGNFLGGRAFWG